MTVRSAWLTEFGQTREDTRVTLSGLLTPDASTPQDTPLRARGGIVPGGFALTGTAGAMTCVIGAGRAFVPGGRTAQGTYPVAVTEPETLTIADGDAQYDRIDLVELAVQDGVYDGTAETRALVRLVPGTPAATPVVPNTPDGSALPLYRILVPARVSAGTGGLDWGSAVTGLRRPTVAVGGIVPASGFTGAYAGQYRDTPGGLERWDGSAWVGYPKAVGGIAPAGALTDGSYVGQHREDDAGRLQRWDGSTWQFVQGRTSVLYSASQTSKQSVPSNVWTLIALQTADVDDAAGHDGFGVYTVPRAGWWRVTANITWTGDNPSAGSRGARVYVNGSGVPRGTWLVGAGPAATSVGGGCLVRLAAGDRLALYGLQNSGSTVTTLGGSGYYTNLAAEWIKS
ncbi:MULTISPECIES: hypothetical protein [unclassified Streptomyces]|uniref:hypothetical protein n=1 Tax=unclassified Streptomyces TaxID=2593676 RepID=UPI003D73E13A